MFYNSLSRSDRFATAMKRVLGPFFGHHLSRALEAKKPDLVISTYPFGSAALGWLRAKRAMATPTVTYIPAFHVHPLWAYQGIDMHFVMYDSAPADAVCLTSGDLCAWGRRRCRRVSGRSTVPRRARPSAFHRSISMSW